MPLQEDEGEYMRGKLLEPPYSGPGFGRLLLSCLLLALHCIYSSGCLANKSKYCLSIWKRSLGPLQSNLTSPALARLAGAWTEFLTHLS